jgi:TonB-dependent receptor
VGRNIGSSGNPELDPYTATYFDLGLEWYFAPEALIAATYFRKDIDSLVENLAEDVTLVVPPTTGGGPAVPTRFTLTRPINGEEAYVQGIEFVVQAPFTFLPAPFNGLGGLFNYTFTESEANFTNVGDISSIQLPGLSKNSFNAVLYYQRDKLDVRFAYGWRDEFVVSATDAPGGNPLWQDGFGQLDLSATIDLTKQLAVKFEGLNLTDQGEFLFTNGRKDLPVRRADNERRYAIGLRYAY